jgi:hypothetical protein
MKNYDVIIIKYLDGQLSGDEKREFENELKINTELNDSFKNFKRVKDIYSIKDEPVLEQDYFNGIVPGFRERLEKKTIVFPVRKIGFAFASVTLMIISYLIFQNYFINQNIEDDSIQSITQNLSEDELNELADFISDDSWEIISDEELYGNLNSDDFTIDVILSNVSIEEKMTILSDYNIIDLYFLVDEQEFNVAYDELLSKRIF